MVELYVAGERVGTLADAEKLLPELMARNTLVELRSESGELVGTLLPKQQPLPTEPLIPWDASITPADIERIKGEPGFTFAEMKKRLGWE